MLLILLACSCLDTRKCAVGSVVPLSKCIDAVDEQLQANLIKAWCLFVPGSLNCLQIAPLLTTQF